jgi:chromosome segregation ATPase
MMKYITIFAIFGLVAGDAGSTKVSPVQKVIEMLSEYKVKVQADLDAEAKEMTAYSDYCDKESSDRGYAIKTATRDIAELGSTIQDGSAQVAKLKDEIATLGTVVAGKESELAEATSVRKAEKADFQAAEAELVTSVDQLERAIVMIKRGTGQMASFLQGAKGAKKGAKDTKKAAKDPNADLKLGLSMISKVLDAGWVNAGTKKSLQAMIQTSLNADDKEDAGLVLNQPQPRSRPTRATAEVLWARSRK